MTRASDTARLLGAGGVINDDSNNVDFRIESNDDANMLFVDGSANAIGIRTSTDYGGQLNIETTGQAYNLVLACTDADANNGPLLDFYRNSSSPADNDLLGEVSFRGRNDNSQDVNYGFISGTIIDASDGTEDGMLAISTMVAGTTRSRIKITNDQTVINEDSIDLDFRVESDNATHALFLKGSDGIIHMQTTNDDTCFNNQTGISMGSNNGSALAGVGQFSCASGVALRVNRTNEKGASIGIHSEGTQRATLGAVSTADVYYGCDRGAGIRISDQELMPCNASGALNNDAVDLGHAASFFDDIRATNGTIITSDRNNKQDIEELNDAEKRVATACKGLLRKFRWKSKVEEKGDNARTHFGIIAQDLQDAFTAEGLNAGKYAMFISDTWWHKDGEVWMNESDAPSDATKTTKLGVRYTELLAFIISAI